MSQNKLNPKSKEESINLNLSNAKIERRKRAYALINSGKTPVIISEEEFLVPSQFNAEKKYNVKFKDLWTCNCPDFQEIGKNTGVPCKHIQSIQVWLKLRNSLDLDNIDTKEEACPHCESFNIKRDGIRKNKSGVKQRYSCADCSKRFVLEQLKYIKADGKTLALTMDLYFKGFSLRDIRDHFQQFQNKNIHFDTIRRWIRKYTKLMNNYVKEQKAETSSRWHNDEQMVKVGDKWKWNNNVIDKETRFLLSTHLSKTRTIKDTIKMYKQAKEQSVNLPEEIYTDGSHTYDKAVKKEFNVHKRRTNRTKHIRNVGVAKIENNNLIERYHGEFREFDKVRRGFGNEETMEDINQGFKLYHNFIKKHMSLNGLTPSQIANIELALGKNRWLGLLSQALDYDEELAKHPNTTKKEILKKTP
ncbi:IS1/IS6 family transposase [Candidatus Woesearchaeota archaeon]|nr:IS1/IS6 family transposase [Candidatus Woesearchaeota archaeon]